MRTLLTLHQLESRDLLSAAFQDLPVLPFGDAAVLAHSRQIYALGQRLGRNLNTFARFGDSNSSTYSSYGQNVYPYLNPLGAASYNPYTSGLSATHPELLDTWAVYYNTPNAAGQNSFSWVGPGAWGGYGTWNVLAALDSVIATSNPAIALIMIGTNETPLNDDAGFRIRLTGVIETLTSRGIIPILSTIPPYHGVGDVYSYRVPQVNQVIADVAATEAVPLWNFWRVCAGLPYDGLYQDVSLIHLLVSPSGGGQIWSTDLGYAQNVRNLQALQILDWFREVVTLPPAAPPPIFIAPLPTWTAMPDAKRLYAVGRDTGYSPTVDVYNADTGKLVNRFLAFDRLFGGGVRVATGDVNGDGFTDVICATAAGTIARVRAFSGKDGSMLAQRVPFGGAFTGGLSVAVGDLNGDSVADVVVGKLRGSSGIRVYEGGTFALTSSFQAFPGQARGVNVAVANVAGEGPVVAVGGVGTPVVRLFDLGGSLVSSFHAFSGSRFGVSITAADLDGDGWDELAVARTAGTQRVLVIDPTTRERQTSYKVGGAGMRLGTVRTATSDTLLVGNAPGSRVAVLAFDDLSGSPERLRPTNRQLTFGIFVG